MNPALVTLSVGFLGGVLLRSFFGNIFFSYLCLVLFFVIGLYAWFLKRHRQESSHGIFLISLFILGSGIGILRTEQAFIIPTNFDDWVGERVIVEGVITKEPEEKDEIITLIVSPSLLSNEVLTGKQPRILTRVLLPAEFFYGDKITISGILENPWRGEGNFNYPMYLAKDGVFYEIKNPNVEIKNHGKGNKVVHTLLSFKYAFLEGIQKEVSEPAASLSAGVLLGIKGALGEKILGDLRAAGVIHIIVLSGFNITIIATIAIRLFGSLFSRRFALIAAMIAIILFVIMVGAEATAVRAGIMAGIALFAKLFYRRGNVLQALLLAGVVMSAINPLIVAFDPSFQLSFLATLGLVLLSPFIERSLSHISFPFTIKEIIIATISAQIMVLPLPLYMMEELSLVSLLANILILPIIPFIMLLGFLVGMLGFMHHLLALPFVIILSLLSKYVFFIAHFFGSIPTVHLPLNTVGLWTFYAIIATGVWIAYRKPPLQTEEITKLF